MSLLAGVQTHFNAPVGVAVLRELYAKRFRLARIDAQASTDAVLDQMIDETVAAGLKPYVIVKRPEQLARLATGMDAEFLNEPDLTMAAADYQIALLLMADAAVRAGVQLWAPVISNLNDRGFAFARGVTLPASVHAVFHRYGDNTYATTHAPFTSREAEIQAFKALYPGVPFGCSEFGYHTAPTGWWIFKKRLSDAQASEYLRQEWALLESLGAAFGVVYQLNDGPTDTPADRFGLRRTDGTWKPQAETAPPVVVVPPTEATFAVVTTDRDRGLGGSTVILSLGQSATTNPDGYVPFQVPTQTPFSFSAHHPDYLDYFSEPYVLTTNRQVSVRMTRTTPPIDAQAGFLHTYAHPGNLVYGFATEDGQPWQFLGYSAYLLVSRVLKGEDIRPFIHAVQAYGCNTLVTLGAALSPWCIDHGFKFDPREQATKDAIAKLFDICADERIRVCHLVASDFQYLSDTEKRQAWIDQCALMTGRWNLLAGCGKEAPVNGWDISLFPKHDLHGVLQACGSNGEGNAPINPARDFSLWETRPPEGGGPWHKTLDDAGAGVYEQQAGYSGFPATTCPVVVIEGLHLADTDPDHVGDRRTTDPERALMYGLQVGASCAGGAVLTSLGQEGQLDGPVAAECVRQQVRGMKAAFLRR